MQHFPHAAGRRSGLPDSAEMEHAACLTLAMISRRSFLAILAAFPVNRAFAETPHTPAPGSAERKAIADAMRKTVRKAFGDPGADFVFIFRILRVQGEWAWAEAEPQRAGAAAGQFEGVSFLLRKSSGAWRVAESLPDEVIAAAEPDQALRAWLKSIAAKYPGLPKGMLPSRSDDG